MISYRTRFYEKYVSLNQGAAVSRPSDRDRRYKKAKLLPLLAGLAADAPILEIGCGSGLMLSILKEAGFTNIEGIDISPEQVAIASNQGLSVKQADATEYLQARPERYQAILAFDLIEHFSKDEISSLVTGIHSSLKTGGIFVCQTPNATGLFPRQVMYDDFTHLTFFTPNSARQLFTLHGFGQFSFFETSPLALTFLSSLRGVIWRMIRQIMNLIRMVETGKHQDIWTENFLMVCKKQD